MWLMSHAKSTGAGASLMGGKGCVACNAPPPPLYRLAKVTCGMLRPQVVGGPWVACKGPPPPPHIIGGFQGPLVGDETCKGRIRGAVLGWLSRASCGCVAMQRPRVSSYHPPPPDQTLSPPNQHSSQQRMSFSALKGQTCSCHSEEFRTQANNSSH